MKQIILNNGVVKYNIDVINADIKIYSSSVETPIIKYSGTFDITDKNSVVKIKQILKKGVNINQNNSKNFFGRKNIIIKSSVSNSTVIQIDGDQTRVFINGKEITNNEPEEDLNDEKYARYNNIPKKKNEPIEDPLLEIVLPLNSNNSSFEITSVSGDINIKNLILQNLIVKSTSGDITMEQIDSLISEIDTISGDVSANIIESIANYYRTFNTISGNVLENTTERSMPKLINTKHKLKVNTISGDINVSFKGKRKY